MLPPLPSIPHRSSLTSSLQSNNTFISAPPPPLNSHSHQIPSPPLPALVSPSYSILPALRSPSKKEINFENPIQQYQVRKGGNSVNFGGGSGEATSSLSEAKYDFGRPCSSTAGGAHQAASYGHYPCRAVEEKENLLPASGRDDSSGCAAGGGWTQVVVADKAWGENTTTADYGFEQFEQLLVSTNSSNGSFSFDENKVGEIACTTDRLWCWLCVSKFRVSNNQFILTRWIRLHNPDSFVFTCLYMAGCAFGLFDLPSYIYIYIYLCFLCSSTYIYMNMNITSWKLMRYTCVNYLVAEQFSAPV